MSDSVPPPSHSDSAAAAAGAAEQKCTHPQRNSQCVYCNEKSCGSCVRMCVDPDCVRMFCKLPCERQRERVCHSCQMVTYCLVCSEKKDNYKVCTYCSKPSCAECDWKRKTDYVRDAGKKQRCLQCTRELVAQVRHAAPTLMCASHS